MLYYFQAQAHVTTFDISLIIFSKVWLIVFLTNQLFCFNNAKIACQKVDVVLIDKFGLNNFR